MRRTAIAIYAGVAVALASATFMTPEVYGSWWMTALWVAFAVVLAVAVTVSRMWIRLGMLLLHLSFLAMLGGGALTWLTREKGSVRISEGECVSAFVDIRGDSVALPHDIRLRNFEIIYYPGGVAPRDYVSHLVVDGRECEVSMNRILDLEGYHLSQSSFDSSGATVLSVSHDPYGRTLSYAGYLMFALGGLLLLLSPSCRFRMLLKGFAVGIIFITAVPDTYAGKIAGIPIESADSLRGRQVVYGGRVVTFNTLARDVVMKLHGKPSYRGLSPEQTLVSLRLYPEDWKNEPLIYVKDKSVREALGVAGNRVALSDLFDSEGNYRVEALYGCLGERSRRAVEELDEKVGIVLTLYSGQLIVNPSESDVALPEWRVRLELAYNAVPFTMIIFISLFICSFAFLMSRICGVWLRVVARVVLWLAFLMSATCFALQWVLAGRVPLSNMPETLHFAVMVMSGIAIVMSCRNILLCGLGSLFAGALALVSHLVASNPVVTPLMPVLHSPWLSLHVSLVMTSYALLSFTFIAAIVGLSRNGVAERMRDMSLCMLYPGVWLLGMGIFSGAVWADVSWGQYWAWDPKETWALITMMVYAVPLHRSLVWLHNPRHYHIYMALAVMTILMTYLGVNYLDSMHAYN